MFFFFFFFFLFCFVFLSFVVVVVCWLVFRFSAICRLAQTSLRFVQAH